jgi:putative toxin-antitoxin system antitoxin component (TIGR02293 family)
MQLPQTKLHHWPSVQLSIFFGQMHKRKIIMKRDTELLEGASMLHVDADTALDLALAIQGGLSLQALEDAMDRYELTTIELEQIISRKTLSRRRERGEVLTVEESNRLARLVRAFAVAEGVLGTLEKAKQWMRQGNRALRGETPISLLNTDQGARLVEQILGRIAYGVFS